VSRGVGAARLLRSVGAIKGAGDETQPSSGTGALVSSEIHESSTTMSEVCSDVCTQSVEVMPYGEGGARACCSKQFRSRQV